jgi:hypothetical protein
MATFTILEPMSTGDVIDRAVRLYRRNFTPLVAIVAVPTFIGYVVSLMVLYGYTSLLTGVSGSHAMPVTGIWMLVLGLVGYPVWMFAMLVTVAGLCRVVGDHLMLNEPITFRRCFVAAKRRLGAITLMGFLLVAILIVVNIALVIVFFILMMAVGLIIGAIAASGLPPWVGTVMLVVTVVVAVAGILFVVLIALARLIFLPQIVMIEGESAGNALGRAIRLGKGNWYRIAGIVAFTYFVTLSLFTALTFPVLAGLYLAGFLTPEFFVSPGWTIVYTSFRDISGLLSLPIWIVSFTLLYFDSRVRQEAYDVDLLAREINPGFYWQPTVQPSAFGYQMPMQPGQRTYVQTSPLGLAGYRFSQAPKVPQAPQTPQAPQAQTESEQLREKFERAAESLSGGEGASSSHDVSSATCKSCGVALVAGARFCVNCGSAA